MARVCHFIEGFNIIEKDHAALVGLKSQTDGLGELAGSVEKIVARDGKDLYGLLRPVYG